MTGINNHYILSGNLEILEALLWYAMNNHCPK